MKVLVTGISGLGGHLAPQLLAAGHDVVGLSRDPSRSAIDVATVRGDAATGEGLDAAFEGVDVAYFLINTYERSNGEGFVARDRRVAMNVAAAARRAGLRRLVYLGVPPANDPNRSSAHISSRLEVGRILMDASPESVELGVFTIVSPRSRSFCVVMQMLASNPVIALPPWRRNRTQPMDIRDVFDALLAAAKSKAAAGRHILLGGPEEMTWETLLREVADEMGVRRRFVPLPMNIPGPALRGLARHNGGNPALLLPVLRSLDAGHITPGHSGTELLGIEPRSVREAAAHAVDEFSSGIWKQSEGTPFEPTERMR